MKARLGSIVSNQCALREEFPKVVDKGDVMKMRFWCIGR